ncbi:PEP-CTERM sorting domain-containing protein [Colwellia psychrerythraea]|uniref:PEP motif putative anchor domain protein n=1 Tax=Colwellia psychrerythraea TaxID=28229 RepID=A0A099KT18_COLPS|nr:PEP-CTERM sorting domain-containing protein [Colwellia psychrerythraea]KGJ93646.1 PEP motif putative anchor domain protein [Colwellia psychrerythraea]
MLSSKKIISAITTSLCLFSITILPNAHATLITMSADSIVQVSLDGDNNLEGTVNSGSLSGSEVVARERLNQSQQDKRIASFLQFDVSSLTTDLVNSSFFSASFEVDFDSRLNNKNNLSVMLGQVGSSWNALPGSLPLFELAGTSTNQATLVNNVRTDTFGTYTLDVTDIVRSWVTGGSDNNGFVVFGEAAVYQGAGFNNIGLTVDIPEPTTIAIFALGMIGLTSRRFNK